MNFFACVPLVWHNEQCYFQAIAWSVIVFAVKENGIAVLAKLLLELKLIAIAEIFCWYDPSYFVNIVKPKTEFSFLLLLLKFFCTFLTNMYYHLRLKICPYNILRIPASWTLSGYAPVGAKLNHNYSLGIRFQDCRLTDVWIFVSINESIRKFIVIRSRSKLLDSDEYKIVKKQLAW